MSFLLPVDVEATTAANTAANTQASSRAVYFLQVRLVTRMKQQKDAYELQISGLGSSWSLCRMDQ